MTGKLDELLRREITACGLLTTLKSGNVAYGARGLFLPILSNLELCLAANDTASLRMRNLRTW